MRVVFDVETDGLTPTQIHIVVTKSVDTGEVCQFTDRESFLDYAQSITSWVGHNALCFDSMALERVWGFIIPYQSIVDTLVMSRLVFSTRQHHSLESWGGTFGLKKAGLDITDWSVLTPEMIERCLSDVEINYRLYKHVEKYLTADRWQRAVETEHFIQHHCRILHENGFAFDLDGAVKLKAEIDSKLEKIDAQLQTAFPPQQVLIKEFTPRLTKHGTIARNSVPKILGPDLSAYEAGKTYPLYETVPFNPGSPKQIVERLNEAGWQPTEKTKGHNLALKEHRDLTRFRKGRRADPERVKILEEKLKRYGVYGWKISDENLDTLPDTAPESTKLLAQRLKLANRSNTIQKQWIQNYNSRTQRVHGEFHGIGCWTGRMSHSNPNQGNIPRFDPKQPDKTPYSDRMRALWRAGDGRCLVGVDAESIQLRVLGHYINDQEFINALCSGDKDTQTDPHSLNQRALGGVCKSRDVAKTFIYAWLLGAGVAKLAVVLGCSREEARQANENFLDFYPGLRALRERQIPVDAARGYFEGLDGRYVKIWGDDYDERRHFTLAGYLQSGETIIMRRAAQLWYPRLEREGVPFWWVNMVHDEFVIETLRQYAEYVKETVMDSIRQAGEDLGLRCPMSGEGKVGMNWMEVH